VLDIAYAGGEITSHDMRMRSAVVWSIARRSALAWSVQAIFFPIVTGPCRGDRAGCGPCARSLRR
jgi:hypothetical protein